jgi:hypothetical protein
MAKHITWCIDLWFLFQFFIKIMWYPVGTWQVPIEYHGNKNNTWHFKKWHAIFPKYPWVLTFDRIQISISKTKKPNFTLRIKAKNTLRPTLSIFEKKNHVNKNQWWRPIHRKQKENENKNRHNPKEKKLKNQQKSNKHPMQRGFTSHDVWKRWGTPTKCNNLLKNCYGLRTLWGYGHAMSIIKNKHTGD